MKVQCGQCPAKYAVSDERIQDKKVRIHCKRCNASIVVDGKVNPPLVTSTPARRSARPAPASLPPEPVPLRPDREPESRPSPRPVAHTIMGGLEAPAERLREVRASPPPKPERGGKRSPSPIAELFLGDPGAGMPAANRGFTEPPAGASPNRWRVALTKEDLRWMTTAEIVEAYQAGAVKLETFVFCDGMPTWVTLLEVPEIAAALADADENAAFSSDPTLRKASRPPPRKGAARLESIEGASGELSSQLDDAQSAEPQPFALVAGRANGMSKLSQSSAHADAALPPAAAHTWGAPAAHRESDPGAELASPSYAGVDVRRDVAAGHAAPDYEPAPAPMPFAHAQQAERGSRWIWVIVALLLLGAAAAFVAPRLGFKLL